MFLKKIKSPNLTAKILEQQNFKLRQKIDSYNFTTEKKY